MKFWAACALVVLSGSAIAQVAGGPIIDQPQTPQQPPVDTGSSGGGLGNLGNLGLSISLGKKKPKPPVFEARDAVIDETVAGQLIVIISGSRADAARIAAAGRVVLIDYAPLDAIGKDMLVVQVTAPDTPALATARLGKIKGVSWVQPNYQFQSLGKALPRRFTLHGITLPSQVRVSGTIAMIDTPVEMGNPSLGGAAIQQSIFGASGVPAFHGTAIASLLVGGGEVSGMAQGARLVSLAAFDSHSKASGISQTRYIAKAMQAAWSLRPDVLNLSFGGADDRLLGELLSAIDQRGVCITAAAGNGGPQSRVLFPARHQKALAVTAADERMRGYSHAARGPELDITGIGVGLLANVPGGYAQVSGTSFATAVVTGALLRMPACAAAHDPGLMRAQVAALAQDIGEPGADPVFGAGLLRLNAAAVKKR